MKVFVFFGLALAAYSPSLGQDSIWTAPAILHPGDHLTIYFHSDKSVFARAKAVSGAFYSLDDKNRIVALDLAFRKSGDNWTATAGIPDTAYAIVANVIRPDTDACAAAVAVGLDSSNGQPLIKSYEALAYAYSPQMYPLGTQDIRKSKALSAHYWAALTTEPVTFGSKLFWYLTAKKDTTKVLDLIANLPLDSTATEKDYELAAFNSRVLRNRPMSTLLTNVSHQKFPQGSWRKYDYQMRMLATKDTAEQRSIIREFKKAYPVEAPDQAFMPVLISILQSRLIELGDMSGALALLPADASGLDIAGTYNSIAWADCTTNKDISYALSLSRASLDTIFALESSGRGKPVAETMAQYRKMLALNYALFADTYAYLLYKTGHYKEAFAYEKKSLADAGPKPDLTIIEDYHLFKEKVESPSKVVASLSAFIARGQSDSVIEARFKRLYRGSRSPDSAFAALEAQAKAWKKAEMVKTSLHDSASKFTLADLDGQKVSLDSLKGKTVVIDFWATWCGPCKESFPAMQKIADRYKNDKNVVLLFVDTWENEDDKKQNAEDFIKKSPYTFHVLLDNDNKVVAAYDVDGIPTKFVIDPKGVLRFKAVGFNGDTEATVDELVSMIEIARKN
jgi:thiol-disulfide isomerase/thioredoxin